MHAEFCLVDETSFAIPPPPTRPTASWSPHFPFCHRLQGLSCIFSPTLFPSPALQRSASHFRQGSGGTQKRGHAPSPGSLSWNQWRESPQPLSSHFHYENKQAQGTHLWKRELEGNEDFLLDLIQPGDGDKQGGGEEHQPLGDTSGPRLEIPGGNLPFSVDKNNSTPDSIGRSLTMPVTVLLLPFLDMSSGT